MESTLQIMPVQRTGRNFGEYAEDATIVVEEPVVKSSVSFLDANTNPVTIGRIDNSMRCTYMGKPRVDNRTSGFYIMCA